MNVQGFYQKIANEIATEDRESMLRFEARNRAEQALKELDTAKATLKPQRHLELAEYVAANLRGTLKTPWPPIVRLDSLTSDLKWHLSKLE